MNTMCHITVFTTAILDAHFQIQLFCSFNLASVLFFLSCASPEKVQHSNKEGNSSSDTSSDEDEHTTSNLDHITTGMDTTASSEPAPATPPIRG